LARTLVEQFSTGLESGVRRPLYTFLQGNFLLGSFYKESPDEYRRFKNDEYWRDVPQKPNERNLMRSVLAYTMRTKERGREKLQNRVYKYARVLDYFYQHEVISDEVPLRLKDAAGSTRSTRRCVVMPGGPRDRMRVRKNLQPSSRSSERGMGRPTRVPSWRKAEGQAARSMATAAPPTTMTGLWPTKANGDRFHY
jgi:hypothetical protein